MKHCLLLLFILITTISFNIHADWEESSFGLPNNSILSFTVKGSLIFSGLQGNGIYVSTTSGLTWSQSLTSVNINSLTSNTNTIFAATSSGTPPNVSGTIRKSVNDGSSWSTTNFNTLMVMSITANGNTIFAGTSSATGSGSLYISTDNGTNWSPISLGNSGVFSLAADGNSIFAGTFNQGVYKSTDNGISWNQTSLNNQYVISMAVSGNNIFAGTYSNGLYRSTNNGANWVQATLPQLRINSLITGGGSIFAGTINGFYLSHDLGISWAQRNEGMGDATINALCIYNNYILAGTNKVYRRLISEIIGIGIISGEIPSQYSLTQNYPNPFNPKTNIIFSIPKDDNIMIDIYDLKGALIQTLFYGHLKAGVYKAEVDGTKLPSGVYFYKFISDYYTETKKMTLIK